AYEVADCAVGGRGDAHALALLEQRDDHPGTGVGLPGAGWTLDRQAPAVERARDPARGVERIFALVSQRRSGDRCGAAGRMAEKEILDRSVGPRRIDSVVGDP